MGNSNSLNLILSARKILSVNSIYSAKLVYAPRGPVATIYKTKEAKVTEEWIKEQVKGLDIPNITSIFISKRVSLLIQE